MPMQQQQNGVVVWALQCVGGDAADGVVYTANSNSQLPRLWLQFNSIQINRCVRACVLVLLLMVLMFNCN